MCINDFAQILVWILKVRPQLNVHNLLCLVAGRNSTEFCMVNIHLGKKIWLRGTWTKVYQCHQKIHELCPWSRARLEKLIIPEAVMKLPALKVHYPFSQEFATCAYLEPDESSLHYFIPSAQDMF